MAKKKLCAWDRDEIGVEAEKLSRIVGKPRYYCRRCARAASREAYLCRPEPLR